jgi:hypothetical protein
VDEARQASDLLRLRNKKVTDKRLLLVLIMVERPVITVQEISKDAAPYKVNFESIWSVPFQKVLANELQRILRGCELGDQGNANIERQFGLLECLKQGDRDKSCRKQ